MNAVNLPSFYIFFCLRYYSAPRQCLPRTEREGKRKKDINKLYYEINKDTILSDRKDKYDTGQRSNRHNEEYYRDIASSRVKSAESSKVHYHKDIDESRVKSAESSKVHYHKDIDASRVKSAENFKVHYHKDIDESQVKSAETTKKRYEKHVAASRSKSTSSTSKHYGMNIDELCKTAKHR